MGWLHDYIVSDEDDSIKLSIGILKMAAHDEDEKKTTSLTIQLEWPVELKGVKFDFNMRNMIAFNPTLNILHRRIEEQYRNLPFPPSFTRATILTEVKGGKGDIVGAGHVIDTIQQHAPSIEFDWILCPEQRDSMTFLQCKQPENVHLTTRESSSQLLITGPVRCMWGGEYIKNRFETKIEGPRFGVIEVGNKSTTRNALLVCHYARKLQTGEETSLDKGQPSLLTIYQYLFPSMHGPSEGMEMGLKPGSGIFVDTSRLETPLSRGYCCPHPLLDIQDESLKQDILQAFDCINEETPPDYDRYSFNSGYAHNAYSWGKFIDSVAIHEQEKHVCIVLNQVGFRDSFTTSEFCTKIFAHERLKQLEELGYGPIQVKGSEDDPITVLKQSNPSQRALTLILRPFFVPVDMKFIQLASERILTTGMNTPAEAWAAKCKLYLYEDVANCSDYGRNFLNQQIAIATTIYPQLARLIEIVGTAHKPLSSDEMGEMRRILRDPELSTATLKLCQHITSHYRFQDILIGSLKRAIWHHLIPELVEIEFDALDDDFKTKLIPYLGSFDAEPHAITIHNLPLLAERVRRKVSEHLVSKKGHA